MNVDGSVSCGFNLIDGVFVICKQATVLIQSAKHQKVTNATI